MSEPKIIKEQEPRIKKSPNTDKQTPKSPKA